MTGPILRLHAFDRGDEMRYYAAVDDGSSRFLRAFPLTAGQHAALRQGQMVSAVATRNLGRVRSILDAEHATPLLEGVV